VLLFEEPLLATGEDCAGPILSLVTWDGGLAWDGCGKLDGLDTSDYGGTCRSWDEDIKKERLDE
jgi:hypothetical protein